MIRPAAAPPLVIALLACLMAAPVFAQGKPPSGVSLETSLMDPFFSIYFLRCHYGLTRDDSLIFGAYYLRSEKTFSGQSYPGSYAGLGPMVGYRRMLWKGLYCEDQLLPLYASYGAGGGSAAAGFELWDEFDLGYRFDFAVGGVRLFLNAQGIVGFAVFKTNEPAGFDAAERKNPAFGAPNFYVLPNLLVGVRF